MEIIKNYFKKKKLCTEVNNKYFYLRNLIEKKYNKLLRIDESNYDKLKFKKSQIYGEFNFDDDFKKITRYYFVVHKSEKINIKEIENLGFKVLKGIWNKNFEMRIYNCNFLLSKKYHLYLSNVIYHGTYETIDDAIKKGKSIIDPEDSFHMTFQIKEEEYINL